MGFGASILIMAVGAILTFATNARVKGFNLDNVGVILMIAGAITFVITLVVWQRGRVTVVSRPTYGQPGVDPGAGQFVEERHTYRSPPNL
jgi:Domain of unknown function (DUF6458)